MERAEHSDGEATEPLLQDLLGKIRAHSPVPLPSPRRTAHHSQQQQQGHDNIPSLHGSAQHSTHSTPLHSKFD